MSINMNILIQGVSKSITNEVIFAQTEMNYEGNIDFFQILHTYSSGFLLVEASLKLLF